MRFLSVSVSNDPQGRVPRALPKEDNNDSEWERVSGLSITLDLARQAVVDLGLSPKDFRYAHPKGVTKGFDIEPPASWLEDNELGFKRFYYRLAHGPLEKSAREVIENDVQQ